MENNIIYIIGIIIILVIIFSIIGVLNKITRLDNKVKEALSDIDVALTKRYDTLTKIVEVVKGYSKHEKETLLEVTEMRNKSKKELEKFDNELDKGTTNINAIAENYPELKANENYLMLQKTLVDVEEHLQAARRCYNANVSAYNEAILVFPNNIFANMKHCKEKEFFKATNEERQNVSVKGV